MTISSHTHTNLENKGNGRYDTEEQLKMKVVKFSKLRHLTPSKAAAAASLV